MSIGERYLMLEGNVRSLARRMVICGMHVHVGIEDPDLRIDLMNQVSYFLAHLLALSTSSPFWGGADTGLKCYRLYVGHGDAAHPASRSCSTVGAPTSGTSTCWWTPGSSSPPAEVWWDIRPSAQYPTLEMRVTDVCTRVDDALAVAAVYVCLLRMLYRLRTRNQKWRSYAPFLLEENVWRAQRYGSTGMLMDYGKRRLVPFSELAEELIALLMPEAEEAGCVDELLRVRHIVMDGTSAEHQLWVFRRALNDGAGPERGPGASGGHARPQHCGESGLAVR